MRKPLPKLVLHKETVRALSDLELGRAIGGYTDAAESTPRQCPAAAVAVEESTPKQCGAAAVVVPRG